jgi:hypothetical protein
MLKEEVGSSSDWMRHLEITPLFIQRCAVKMSNALALAAIPSSLSLAESALLYFLDFKQEN